MAVRILGSDIVDHTIQQLIGQSDQGLVAVPDSVFARTHARAGQVQLRSHELPGMLMVDMRWQTADAVRMEDDIPSVNININFQLQGHMYTRFGGLKEPLQMTPGRHNLVFTPEAGDCSELKRQDNLEMLHLSIDKEHFVQLIGCESAWSERVLRGLEAGIPFAGMEGTGKITPVMTQLIRDVQLDTNERPMRRLIMQARATELLALQLEQFMQTEQKRKPGPIPQPDAEKLHLLKLYLDQHFLEELTLTQLSRISLLNEFKIKKGFRELFGTTIFGYLRDLRMGHAATLLRDHRVLVEEVAFILGYQHPHHFSVAFRKYFGLTPSAFILSKNSAASITESL